MSALAQSGATSTLRALDRRKPPFEHDPPSRHVGTLHAQAPHRQAPSVRPMADTMRIGIGLSSASRTAMDTATWVVKHAAD